jgi:hypothetical protein
MSYNYNNYYLSNIQKIDCKQIIRLTNAIYSININKLTEDEMNNLFYSQDHVGSITSEFNEDINKCKIDDYYNLLVTYTQVFKQLTKSIVLRRRYRIDYVINKSVNEIQKLISNLNEIINNYSQEDINYDELDPTNKLMYKILYKNIRDILSYDTESPSSNITDEYYNDAIGKYNKTRNDALIKINELINKFNSAIESEKITGGAYQRKKSRSRSRDKGRSKSNRSKSKKKSHNKKKK